MDYEERIKSLSDMFMESLEQLELSRTLAQMNTEDLVKYRVQYIGEVIKANIYNQKQKYILELLQQVEELKKINVNDEAVEIQLKHQKQIEALKNQLEQREIRPQGVDGELRRLIQQKMQQLEKDYILKVIHQQEMKALQRKLTNGKQYRSEGIIEQLRLQNQMIKNQIEERYGREERRCREAERSPVRQLDQIYTTLISPVSKMPALQIQSIKQIPLQFLNQTEPLTTESPENLLKRSKSIQTFNELKDNFQKQLSQLKQTVHAKHNKIVKSRQQLQLTREVSPRLYLTQTPFYIQQRLKTNRVSIPHLDHYTFARCEVGSPTIKKTTRGSQRVLNARKPNAPEQCNLLSYRYV